MGHRQKVGFDIRMIDGQPRAQNITTKKLKLI